MPDIFSDDEIKQMTEYMRMAIEEAKKGLQEGKVRARHVLTVRTCNDLTRCFLASRGLCHCQQ